MSAFNIHIPTIAPELGSIQQVAYIVEDIDQAVARWGREYGIGPFVIARNEKPMTNAFYRGKKAEDVVVDLAFGYFGELQIELITLKNVVPSMYSEVIERKQADVQHYGVLVEDFVAATEFAAQQGFKPVVEAGIKGLAQMHYVEATDFEKNVFAEDEASYMKTPEGHGIVLEVIEFNAMTRPYFDAIKKMVDEIPAGQLVKDFKLSSITPVGAVVSALGKFLLNRLLGRT